jgi:hypothetical protein
MISSIIANSSQPISKTNTMRNETKFMAGSKPINKKSISGITKNTNNKRISGESNSSNTATKSRTKIMSSQRFKDTNNSKSSRSDINITEVLGVPSSIMEEKSRKTSTNANNSIRTSLSKSSESQKTNSFNSRIKNKKKVNITNIKLNKIEEV